MNRFGITALIALFLVLSTQPVYASEVGVSVTFSDAEIRAISAWYSDNRSPGKGKQKKGGRDGLPPGIAKNLARGKSLPPGIAMRYLPVELQRQLPPLPAGYDRVIVGGKVLLVEVATQIIHDVLMDVVVG